MKKIILTALVAVASLSASAQVYLGGAIGFSSNKGAGENAKSQGVFTLAPEVGYDINEKWSVGADLNFQFANNSQGENLGGEVYGRFNYLKTGIATLFVELGVGYSVNKFEADEFDVFNPLNAQKADSELPQTKADATEAAEDNGQAKTKTFNVGLRPGVKIALSDKVSLVAKTGLIGYKKVKDGPSQLNIGVDNDAIKLGVYYSF